MPTLVTLILTFSLREKEQRLDYSRSLAEVSLALRERAGVRVNRSPRLNKLI